MRFFCQSCTSSINQIIEGRSDLLEYDPRSAKGKKYYQPKYCPKGLGRMDKEAFSKVNGPGSILVKPR